MAFFDSQGDIFLMVKVCSAHDVPLSSFSKQHLLYIQEGQNV